MTFLFKLFFDSVSRWGNDVDQTLGNPSCHIGRARRSYILTPLTAHLLRSMEDVNVSLFSTDQAHKSIFNACSLLV